MNVRQFCYSLGPLWSYEAMMSSTIPQHFSYVVFNMWGPIWGTDHDGFQPNLPVEVSTRHKRGIFVDVNPRLVVNGVGIIIPFDLFHRSPHVFECLTTEKSSNFELNLFMKRKLHLPPLVLLWHHLAECNHLHPRSECGAVRGLVVASACPRHGMKKWAVLRFL